MILHLADVALIIALGSTTTLLIVYGLLQPWWRSWFGIGMILTLFAVWQMLARAQLTTIFGENYAGRDLVLLIGRTEIAIAMSVSTFFLGRELIRDMVRAGSTEIPPGAPSSENEYV